MEQGVFHERKKDGCPEDILINSTNADIDFMGKLLLVLAVVGALVIAGGAYFYFFYGDNTLSAELDEDNGTLVVKGPSVDAKIDKNKIGKIELYTWIPTGDKDLVSGSENSKIRSGTFKYGDSGMQCTANYYKGTSYHITVWYDREYDMPGDLFGRLIFNLDSDEKTEDFAKALWAFTGATYEKDGILQVL